MNLYAMMIRKVSSRSSGSGRWKDRIELFRYKDPDDFISELFRQRDLYRQKLNDLPGISKYPYRKPVYLLNKAQTLWQDSQCKYAGRLLYHRLRCAQPV